MDLLTSLNEWQILLVMLLFIGVVTALAWLVIRRFLVGPPRERAGVTAAAYMTALGSLFAILTGFLIALEYTTLREANHAVGAEVAAASQLAYATGVLPPADAERLQDDLTTYLQALRSGEWPALSGGVADRSPAAPALRSLQQAVFEVANRPYVPNAASSTLQGAVNDLTANRRQRVVIASGGMPAPLFALSVIAGLALIINSLLVAYRQGGRYALVAAGIILAVALDLGAILAISAPFSGAFVVSTDPISGLITELKHGEYLPWVATR